MEGTGHFLSPWHVWAERMLFIDTACDIDGNGLHPDPSTDQYEGHFALYMIGRVHWNIFSETLVWTSLQKRLIPHAINS